MLGSINLLIVALVCMICQISAQNCFQWVIGFSGDSCSTTCAKLSKTCSLPDLQSITNAGAFDSMVAASTALGKNTVPGSSSAFCTGGINGWPFATAPAVMEYQLYVKNADGESGQYVTSNSCYYPTGSVAGDCDTAYTTPPSQRFCPCNSATC